MGPDQSFVLIAESWKERARRYWLTGSQQGQSDIFIDMLPGYPDNVTINGKYLFWLAIFNGTILGLDLLGNIKYVLEYPVNSYSNLTSVTQHNNKLYLGSLTENFIGFIQLPGSITNINYTQYAYHVQISSHFMHVGIDTLTINTNIFNPKDHNFMASALLANVDSAIVDSVLLYDDGNHADEQAGDGLFGCYIGPQSTENEFIIAIKIVDLDTVSDCIAENAARFTTIGPVVFDGYTITSSDMFPNPGDRQTFQFTLANKGLNATAKNVTATLISLDTCTSIISIATSEYGDIAPGETSTGIGSHRVYFLSSCSGNTYARFRLDIASNGYMFWSDTFSVFVTSVREVDGKHKIPSEFVLHQNYPNPFNASTTIIYSTPEPGLVILKVYDLIGREIKILVNKFVEAGTQSINFDATNLPSGIYIYRLQAGDLMKARKMLLMR